MALVPLRPPATSATLSLQVPAQRLVLSYCGLTGPFQAMVASSGNLLLLGTPKWGHWRAVPASCFPFC